LIRIGIDGLVTLLFRYLIGYCFKGGSIKGDVTLVVDLTGV
jgi:hypothetical protein